MNIAMFTNTYSPMVGGVERSITTFIEEFERAGEKCLVVAPRFRGGDQSDDRILRVPAIRNFNRTEFSIRLPAPRIIRERLEAFEPDVIHAHHPFLLGDSALRFAYELGVPLVFTHHTLYEQYTHYVPFDSEALKRLVVRLGTEYANLCDLVLAPSESIAEILVQRGVTTPVSVAPTGIRVARFSGGCGEAIRSELGIPSDAPVIGHVGRLAEEKNLYYLARAVAATLRDHPDAWFLVVGSGEMDREIRGICDSAGVRERVRLAGSRTGHELANAYAAMDLFAFSSHSETQGLVVAEAMASGTPVIALDASGVREVLRDRENGRLLPSDSSEAAFSKALGDALSSGSVQWRRWQAGARRAAEHFDHVRCARTVLDHYAELIKQTQGDRAEVSTFWDRLVARMEAEWDLIVGKTTAAVQTVASEEESDEDEPSQDDESA